MHGWARVAMDWHGSSTTWKGMDWLGIEWKKRAWNGVNREE